MNPELLIVTVGYCISVVITAGLGTFVLFTSADRQVRIPFFLMTMAISIFELSFVLGVNVKDPELSRRILMFNVADIFIVIFNAHWILAVIGKAEEKKRDLAIIYGLGFFLFLIYTLFPSVFLKTSMPKLYFPNYYVGGPGYIWMVVFFFCVTIYFYYQLVRAYLKANVLTKNRLKYFIAAIAVGYGVGSTGFPLVLGVNFDPIFSMLTGFYTIPLTYGIVRYQLMDIRDAIRKGFFYSMVIAILSGTMVGVSLLSDWFTQNVPGFQTWIVPLIAGLTVFVIGYLFWQKSKEAERLKYEFITVAAHKLRTPLTHIKWVADALLLNVQTKEARRLIYEIKKSDDRLVELADILLETTKEEGGEQIYTMHQESLIDVTVGVLGDLKYEIEKKNLTVHFKHDPGIPKVFMDTKRMISAIHIFLDNAVMYTPISGTIDIFLKKNEKNVIFSVSDSGIGIARADMPYIFKKFFRTHKASLTDTEGSGMGLFIAKNIIERHGGSVGIRSEGEGRGSTFWFSLPTEQ